MRFFARRQHAPPSSDTRAVLVPTSSAKRRASRTARRCRPTAEGLDSRLLLTASTAAPAAVISSAQASQRVAQVLQPYLSSGLIPGASVSVVINGQVVLTQGYGVSNVATRSPVQATTRFDIGSVTKTFTAVGILLLYQESQGTSRPLNLNAPIKDYLHNTPGFKLPKKWANITTQQLLNMTSGIGDSGSPTPWRAQLNAVAAHPLLFTPGTQSSYSDPNYYLLGEIIEQWTGEAYGTFIQNEILNPLGLSNTQELGRSARVANQAVGYTPPANGKFHKAAVQNGTEMYAAAGIVSNAEDMATYMNALLSEQILNPTTYAMMWSAVPTPQYGTSPPISDLRGLGWDRVISTGAGATQVMKSGQVPGFNSELILYPSNDSGVFVSFNTNYHNTPLATTVTAQKVAESIYAAVLQ